jgi:hypothetical protein
VSLTFDIADYLTSQGFGQTTTSTGGEPINIFRNISPTDPAHCVMLFENGGAGTVHAMNSVPGVAVVERPAIQIRVRDKNHDTARSTINDVFKTIDGLRERTINGTRYLWIEALQSPFLLERDDDNREVFVFNALVTKELS